MSDTKLISYKKSFNYVIDKIIYDNKENGTSFFRAKDAANGRTVGIKRIRTNNKKLLDEYKREINVLIKLEEYSCHIPSVYDYNVGTNEMTIIMSYINGPTLAELLGQEQGKAYDEHNTRRNIFRIKSLANILAEIHRLPNAQHKDLKPVNIIIKQYKGREEMFVIDFGLTGTLSFKGTGTKFYQAPEQSAIFSDVFPSDRIDVFAFGLIAYEMLEGKKLKFLEDLVLDREKGEWKDIPEIQNPHVNNRIKTTIKKCLAYNPNNRYKDGSEIVWSLNRQIKNKHLPM